MQKSHLTQITLASLVIMALMTTPVRADDTDQLKQQVADLQAKVNQLESQLGDQQRAPSAAPVYDQYQWQDPFTQMMLMQRQMERNMQQAFAGRGTFNPRMDMNQTDKEYMVTMDIPGMDKTKINVETKQGMLIVSGERRSETDNNGSANNNQYYRQERSFGSFTQAIPLPDDARKDQINASYKNGVLRVTIPRMKREENQNGNKKITVQ